MNEKEIYMRYIQMIFLTIFLLLLSVGCSEDVEATFRSASHAPNDTFLTGNIPLQLSVTGHYDDGSTQDLTSALIWESSDESIATVVGGLITPKDSDGSVVITYTSKDTLPDGMAIFTQDITYQSRSAVLKSIAISPQNVDIFIGESKTFSALGVFETSAGEESIVITNECDWSSGDSSLLKVEAEVATGISIGKTTLEATYKTDSSIGDESNVSILESSYDSVSVISEKNNLNVGETLQFEAIGENVSGSEIVITDQVTWSSSNVFKISMSSDGVATGLSTGDDIKITASIDGKEGYSTASVKREEYLQLFRISDEKQLNFPYYGEYHTDEKKDIDQPSDGEVLETYGLVAVGKRFTITDLKYSDFNGTIIQNIEFANLTEGQTILQDEVVEFTVVYKNYNIVNKQLRFSFSVDDEPIESFVSTYEIVE